jgi:gas vesicle protein
MEDNGNRLSYFFLGLGMGVAVGLLFAPQSGEETRDLLKNKADDAKDKLRRKGQEIRETAEEALSRSRESITRQRENLTAAVDAGKQAYREAVTGAGEFSR